MIDDKQVDRLLGSDDFVAFLQEVRDRREAAIQQLHDRPDSGVQQIAGRILEGDEILKLGEWEILEQRRRRQ